MKYELFYGSGGHGGPYPNIREAISRAKALLKGSALERVIKVVSYKTWANWRYTFPYYRVDRTVRKHSCGRITVERG